MGLRKKVLGIRVLNSGFRVWGFGTREFCMGTSCKRITSGICRPQVSRVCRASCSGLKVKWT